MLGALLLIAVVLALVAFAALVSTAPNQRRARAPWWLAWLFAVPFLGPVLGGSGEGDSDGGGGGDGGHDFGGGDFGGGGDGSGGGE